VSREVFNLAVLARTAVLRVRSVFSSPPTILPLQHDPLNLTLLHRRHPLPLLPSLPHYAKLHRPKALRGFCPAAWLRRATECDRTVPIRELEVCLEVDVSVLEQLAVHYSTTLNVILTIYRRAGKTGEDVLDDIICADFKKGHTLKKTVRWTSE
jgi:hypothetical protein